MQIKILPPEEARKIAAGEVIDRPASLLRELLDNALDADSRFIDLAIEAGGARKIEVVDDGCGMDKSDLELCYYTHATSKIRSLKDLDRAETLGFRGEALSAAAAVAELDILTSTDGREAWRLETVAGGARPPIIERTQRVKGTTVRCLNLFDTIPARKRFLKREYSESAFCYQAFIEKALAFPAIGFRFSQNGKVKTMLAPAASLKERCAALIVDKNEAGFLHTIKAQGEGFSVNMVVGGAELAQKDRKKQFLFANGRRIQDFSLLSALEYGLQGVFPNGTHPLGAIFITIAPNLADFNIHPAKREARFVNNQAIYQTILAEMKNFGRHTQTYAAFSPQTPAQTPVNKDFSPASRVFWKENPVQNETHREKERQSLALSALLDSKPAFAEPPKPFSEQSDRPLVYLGRAFELFIIVERENSLFLIDQHAAHERLLYEEYLANPIPAQELLVSIPFMAENEEDDRFFEQRKADLARLGVSLERNGDCWNIKTLPVGWTMRDSDTIKAVRELKQADNAFVERWCADLACHQAVKDRDYLDETAALALAAAALALPRPFCPHGRPLWLEISRADLFKAVKRS